MHTLIRFTLREVPTLPVEAQALVPENTHGKDASALKALPLLVGNRTQTAGEYFDVEILDAPDPQPGGHPPQERLEITGDLTRFKRLGERMSRGRLEIRADVGFHAGAFMSGGTLAIHGCAGDYLGAHMSGGTIEVSGNAGHFAGAPYRGHAQGMTGGCVIIRGNAGQMAGARMRRGLLVVCGTCGDLAGCSMRAGTVVIGGQPGVRAGAGMVRGTVIALERPPEMLPTFRYDCAYSPPAWPLLRSFMAAQGVHFPHAGDQAVFERYSGDINEGARGEVLVCQAPK